MAREIKKFSRRILSFSFLLCLILQAKGSKAQGDLLIYPKRITLGGPKRIQQISLSNIGKDTAQYFISVIQIRMRDDGSFETIRQPDTGQRFADKYFRFFPKRVVLAPGEAQVVKVQLVNISELLPGEYRSHLYFRSEERKSPLGERKQENNSSISVRIKPVFGVSIPVIIRSGESTMDMALSKIAFKMDNDSIPTLNLDLLRTGNMSIYGDLSVDYISDDGKELRVATAKGLAVYTPNELRHFKLVLDKKAGIDYHKGALHIVFTDQSGKVVKMAQEQIFL